MTRLEEVALEAGVSKSTVSRVVNGGPYVSARARSAVLAAIDRLGYRPNQAARSLAGNRTDCVGLVVGDRSFDAGLADLLRGVDTVLSGLGLRLVVSTGASVDGVDGVLRVGGGGVPAGVPVVSFGHAVGVPYVAVDDFSGGVAAVRHLVGRGRRRIAAIAGGGDVDRLNGWYRGMGRAGLSADLVVRAEADPASGARAMSVLLSSEPGLDGVFVGSDVLAYGALEVLRTRGLGVPSDVAVVGFGDLPSSSVVGLTAVRPDHESLGRSAAHLMATVLSGSPVPPFTLVPPSLVLRST
ncbi:DNA-binding LacI/PurR family transcriptional regulator [Saccharothrix violaceirubra]|uniref:DNA-binding LacI/PurR family transcriptional regulator n=1 Tax=Saccharothrix violaceirubra TaxID=413306 RepID=A0A7W7T897_9PSEU|nr:DNA-binding LacI/PurR family transcriptional regulator [Saccharothrix violaceirubra]